jgi:hypothetical protein
MGFLSGARGLRLNGSASMHATELTQGKESGRGREGGREGGKRRRCDDDEEDAR